MRVVGLITKCGTFKDIEKIVTNASVVFNFPICSNQLEESLKYLEDVINTFQFPVEQENKKMTRFYKVKKKKIYRTLEMSQNSKVTLKGLLRA